MAWDDFNTEYAKKLWENSKRATSTWWSGFKEEVGAALTSATQSVVNSGESALQKIVSGVDKVLPNLLPTVTAALATLSYRGTQGDFSTLSYPVVLRADFQTVTGIDEDRFGRPAMATHKLGDLTGFCLCKSSKIAIDGTTAEESAIEEMLNSGVFLEW